MTVKAARKITKPHTAFNLRCNVCRWHQSRVTINCISPLSLQSRNYNLPTYTEQHHKEYTHVQFFRQRGCASFMTSKPKGIFGISARCLQYKFPYISLINERSNMLKVDFAKSLFSRFLIKSLVLTNKNEIYFLLAV